MHQFGQRKNLTSSKAIRAEIDRLEKLAADLEVVSTHPFPLEQMMAKAYPNAPTLDEWRFAVRPVPCLVGLSTGHPRLPGDRRPIVTSEMFLISEELGWARSFSRWYRLGRGSWGGELLMAAVSKAAVPTFESRLARHFLRRLSYAAGDAALEQATRTGILELGYTVVDGRRVKIFRPGPVVQGRSGTEIRRILQKGRRRAVRQKWQFGSDENGFNLPTLTRSRLLREAQRIAGRKFLPRETTAIRLRQGLVSNAAQACL